MACLPEELLNWLKVNYPFKGEVKASPIDPDGSTRSFYRLKIGRQKLVLMFSPHNLPESMAWFKFNQHLASKGLPVPLLKAALPEAGIFLMQDMGETSLQQAANAGGQTNLLYRPVLSMLAQLHACGLKGMDATWCFDSPSLNADFLRAREMDYFFRQVVEKYHLPRNQQLQQEFDSIAEQAAAARPWGLVHRDMQSRNIVLDNKRKPGLVDFQGARPGPIQYDLASLLNDPYVDLPAKLRQRLLKYYLQQLAQLMDFDQQEFLHGLPWVALSRNLQTLAAYVFLSTEKAKFHFIPYLLPATRNLQGLLQDRQLAGLSALREVAGQLQQKLAG